jgi:hypothetical protein
MRLYSTAPLPRAGLGEHASRMPEPAPKPELLQSLGRLARGLSALFWGLPLALIVGVQTVKADWITSYTVAPPLLTTGLLLFGLWQMSAFQKQERPWRHALENAGLLALINVGLSPFLFWWSRVPENTFLSLMVAALGACALLFLFSLNTVILRLGAMLPDEALRHEIRQYTALNRTLLAVFMTLLLFYFILSKIAALYAWRLPALSELLSTQTILVPSGLGFSSGLLIWLSVSLLICFLLLLPLAMTIALILKTKEVILENFFGGGRN